MSRPGPAGPVWRRRRASSRAGPALVAVLMTVQLLGPPTAAWSAGTRTYGSFPFQRGMNIWSWTSAGYRTAAFTAALHRLAGDGVQWVSLVPTWFQRTTSASEITPLPGFTASDAAMSSAVRTAHALGFKVIVKPQLNVSNGAWRGSVVPSSPATWWGSYDAFVLHYANLAARAGADELVVGTELAGVSSETGRWRALVHRVRGVFHGYLTYAALPFEYGRIGFWEQLDAIGVDAYWPLSKVPTTSVAGLVAAWKPLLSQLATAAARWDRPVVFTEAGYASQAGTATDPSALSLSSVPAPDQQATAYAALLEATADRPWFRGVNWWAWRQTNETSPTDFTPEGKPAETVLRQAWGRHPEATSGGPAG